MWFDNHARRVLSPHLSGAPLASLLTRRAFGPAFLFWGMEKRIDDGSGPQIGKTHQTENYGSQRIVKVSYLAAKVLN